MIGAPTPSTSSTPSTPSTLHSSPSPSRPQGLAGLGPADGLWLLRGADAQRAGAEALDAGASCPGEVGEVGEVAVKGWMTMNGKDRDAFCWFIFMYIFFGHEVGRQSQPASRWTGRCRFPRAPVHPFRGSPAHGLQVPETPGHPQAEGHCCDERPPDQCPHAGPESEKCTNLVTNPFQFFYCLHFRVSSIFKTFPSALNASLRVSGGAPLEPTPDPRCAGARSHCGRPRQPGGGLRAGPKWHAQVNPQQIPSSSYNHTQSCIDSQCLLLLCFRFRCIYIFIFFQWLFDIFPWFEHRDPLR